MGQCKQEYGIDDETNAPSNSNSGVERKETSQIFALAPISHKGTIGGTLSFIPGFGNATSIFSTWKAIKGLKGILKLSKNNISSLFRFQRTISSSISQSVPKLTSKVVKHMENPHRYVPMRILQEAIKYGKAVPAPRGSRATMYYIEMYKNNKIYTLEVLYDKQTNTIWHFLYR